MSRGIVFAVLFALLPGAVEAQRPPAPPIGASTRFLAPEYPAALIVRPGKLPKLEANIWTGLVNQLQRETGLNLLEMDEVLVLLGTGAVLYDAEFPEVDVPEIDGTEKPVDPNELNQFEELEVEIKPVGETFCVVLRSPRPLDPKAILAKLKLKAKQLTHKQQTYFLLPEHDEVPELALAFPDARTAVYCQPAMMPYVLDVARSDSPLARLLAQADPKRGAELFFSSSAALLRVKQLAAAEKTHVPLDQVSAFLNQFGSVQVTVASDLTLVMRIQCPDAAAAQQMGQLLGGAIAEMKRGYQEMVKLADEIPPGTPPEFVRELKSSRAQLQVVEKLKPETNGTQVIVRLDGTTAKAALSAFDVALPDEQASGK